MLIGLAIRFQSRVTARRFGFLWFAWACQGDNPNQARMASKMAPISTALLQDSTSPLNVSLSCSVLAYSTHLFEAATSKLSNKIFCVPMPLYSSVLNWEDGSGFDLTW